MYKCTHSYANFFGMEQLLLYSYIACIGLISATENNTGSERTWLGWLGALKMSRYREHAWKHYITVRLEKKNSTLDFVWVALLEVIVLRQRFINNTGRAMERMYWGTVWPQTTNTYLSWKRLVLKIKIQFMGKQEAWSEL